MRLTRPSSPPSLHPVLMGLPFKRPGVRRRQAQVEAALIEVLQDDLSIGRPF